MPSRPARWSNWPPRSATLSSKEGIRDWRHLGPNPGVVELTLALHRTFDSPRPILWDTATSPYVQDRDRPGSPVRFVCARRMDCPGYLSRAESPHDVIENSHASTALSTRDGILWRGRRGELATAPTARPPCDCGSWRWCPHRGMAWKRSTNCRRGDRRVIIVVNDNAPVYAPHYRRRRPTFVDAANQ